MHEKPTLVPGSHLKSEVRIWKFKFGCPQVTLKSQRNMPKMVTLRKKKTVPLFLILTKLDYMWKLIFNCIRLLYFLQFLFEHLVPSTLVYEIYFKVPEQKKNNGKTVKIWCKNGSYLWGTVLVPYSSSFPDNTHDF